MAVNTQFSIAVHVMAGLGVYRDRTVTTTDLAASINATASFVRRTIAKLAKAGLVETSLGKGGECRLARDPRKIFLLEIYQAVEAPKAFAIHAYPVQKGCQVSANIKRSLGKALDLVQRSTEASLAPPPPVPERSAQRRAACLLPLRPTLLASARTLAATARPLPA